MIRPPSIAPTHFVGPVTLRPRCLTDLPVIREAAADPYIPLVTTVPAERVGAQRRDMYLYALLPGHPR
ncbi:hypothetical protein [Kitasatospora sp. NPDC097691]|uniref:hypothetical protein n=1 Tax=Kitasatospora sp. NPDC097691 TaxID=3157231 RepID=UPI00332F6264